MLSVITLEKADDWDGIVKSFGNYDVCYLSGYAKAFSIRGDGEPMLLYYKNGSTRAMNVVFKRDIAVSNPFRDILPKNTFLISPLHMVTEAFGLRVMRLSWSIKRTTGFALIKVL